MTDDRSKQGAGRLRRSRPDPTEADDRLIDLEAARRSSRDLVELIQLAREQDRPHPGATSEAWRSLEAAVEDSDPPLLRSAKRARPGRARETPQR
jgi:hypothetical protein